jgi:drug/metabolite transporter (DMT)-like permease
MLQDQNVLFGLALLPFYIHEQTSSSSATLKINLEGITSGVGFSLGLFALAYAYRHAKAGNIMAIENSKGVIQTLTVVIIEGLIPNGLEISGVVVGLLGVLFIVLQS